MKKQYRVVKETIRGYPFYSAEYSYPVLPFWFHYAVFTSLEKAKQWIKDSKAYVPDPPNEVIYRE